MGFDEADKIRNSEPRFETPIPLVQSRLRVPSSNSTQLPFALVMIPGTSFETKEGAMCCWNLRRGEGALDGLVSIDGATWTRGVEWIPRTMDLENGP
jgi:hypothetical protein